jgi:hypothetical protein
MRTPPSLPGGGNGLLAYGSGVGEPVAVETGGDPAGQVNGGDGRTGEVVGVEDDEVVPALTSTPSPSEGRRSSCSTRRLPSASSWAPRVWKT